jgi:hypothetical protein
MAKPSGSNKGNAEGRAAVRPKAKNVSPGGAAQSKSDKEVRDCIGQQSGGNIITVHAQLGKLGVSGLILAGCLNGKFGAKFKGNDFPGTMEVGDCIRFVRKKVK